MKTCIECNENKYLDGFTRYSRSKDGRTALCKQCRAVRRKIQRLNDINGALKKEREYRCNNKEIVKRAKDKWLRKNKNYHSEYVEKNLERVRNKQKEWRKDNEKRLRKKASQYRENNRERISKKSLDKYHKNKHKVQFRLATNLRARLRSAIKNNSKVGSAVKDLGCSIEELKVYLESKFQSGMSWKNYGKWHIDHIIPLASFDLSDREQFLEACHYTNLQPLWAKDNLVKGDRIK